MTGLNLEGFLHLLRADLGALATLGLIALVLSLMAWTSWGSHKALRKCLVLSVLAHCGIVLYAGTAPVVMSALRANGAPTPPAEARIRNIKVAAWTAPAGGTEPNSGGPKSAAGRPGAGSLAAWDRTVNGLALADSKLLASKTDTAPIPAPKRTEADAIAPAAAAPETQTPTPPKPEDRPEPAPDDRRDTTPPPPTLTAEAAAEAVAPALAATAADAPPQPAGTDAVPDRRLGTRRVNAAAVPLAPSRPPLAPSRPSDVIAPLPAPPALALNRTGASPDTSKPAVETAGAEGLVRAPEVVAAQAIGSSLALPDTDLRARNKPASATTTPGRRPRGQALPTDVAPPIVMAPSSPGPSGPIAGPQPTPAESVATTASPLGTGEVKNAEVVTGSDLPPTREASPESDIRRLSRPATTAVASLSNAGNAARRPLPSTSVTPSGVVALPDVLGASAGRPLAEVPEVYRSRLDPNRSATAFRSGASPASEQAVERALDWLARHQDTDGRWDSATAKYDDGSAVKGDDDYTVHCPPGETCFGESIYWDADTALTGLSLLAYLGAGYTHTEGKYAQTVSRGLNFLITAQKPDGDLRGPSRVVGMYCHAMASIALCEAYALTGDPALKRPVERAIAFIATARAKDGLSWRYAPGAPVGDTSILGWVVMALKSAREVGIEVPTTLQAGSLGWLDRVAAGDSRGLARYQPWDNITPTMTAEAWVCRQFLGVGGPGAASTEAAEFLLARPPKSGKFDIYYVYYGTLAMYQHGGPAWTRWNAQTRDEIVRRQRPTGHIGGSWDPDESIYGAKGGRIYSTALATLSLEVYYRFLRLYDEPSLPPTLATPTRPRTLGRADPNANPTRPGNTRPRVATPRR